jgi:drug/metabolite transporter (DMT)-like permease
MRPARVLLLTALAMLAFAGNSVLCRLALKHTGIDPATFTSVRLISGAMVLWLLVRVRDGRTAPAGNWPSALALFAYAAAFSWAYVSLPTAAGALLLFGAVQATMISYGLWQGERLAPRQTLGLLTACAGLIALMLPGLSAPPLGGALLMMAAGVAWGIYSLRGKSGGDATQTTSGNFQRAALLTLVLTALTLPQANLDSAGLVYAVVSGAITSGLGYAVWYTAMRGLPATSAATVQLSVPVIAALGGALFLHEPLSLRLVASSLAILGGVALVIMGRRPA